MAMNACPHCGATVTPMATFCLKCRKAFPRNPVPSKAAVRGESRVAPTATPTTPPVIARLATTALIQAGFATVYGLTDWFVSRRVLMAVVMLGLSFSLVAMSIGLNRFKSWARGLQVVIALVGLLAIPVGTILYLFVLAYLFKPGTKSLFSGRPVSSMLPAEARDVHALATTWRPLAMVLGVLNVFALLALVGGGAAVFFGAMSRPM